LEEAHNDTTPPKVVLDEKDQQWLKAMNLLSMASKISLNNNDKEKYRAKRKHFLDECFAFLNTPNLLIRPTPLIEAYESHNADREHDLHWDVYD